jgi:hypothetical protein
MTILSWFSITANKSVVAAEIQTILESFEKFCIVEIPSSKLANQLVELAYTNMPSLSNTKYNKYVKAAIALAMAPLFPSISYNQRGLCKLSLGSMLRIVNSLEQQGLIRLSQPEKNILERAQQLYIQTSTPDPNINLGDASFAKSPHQEQANNQTPINSNECNFTDREVNALKILLSSIERKCNIFGFIEITPLSNEASVAGIGAKNKNGNSFSFFSIVKHKEQNSTTFSVRGFNGRPLPNCPDYFDDINDLISFTHPYLDLISTGIDLHQ